MLTSLCVGYGVKIIVTSLSVCVLKYEYKDYLKISHIYSVYMRSLLYVALDLNIGRRRLEENGATNIR